jgi:type I restriction enzyme S subunit
MSRFTKLKEITEVITKGTTPSTYGFDFIEDGEINFIRAEGISKDGYVDSSTFLRISLECDNKLKRSRLAENDILFSIAGMALGKTGIVKQAYLPANTNQAVAIIRPKTEIVYPRYLHYYFINPLFYKKVNSISGQAAQPNINLEQVGSLEINLPSLPTQKRIAAILSAYDDLIENNLKRIKLLEEIAQRTYEEWFVKFRVNGEQLPVDEETGLPVGWKIEPFNTIVEIVSGYPFKSSDYVEDGKFKIVTIKNVQDGYFVPETTDSILEMPTKLKAEQVLNTSDIIVSLTGNVGRICLVYGDNYLLNQRVAKVVPLDEYSKAYVYFLLRSKAMITSLENLSNGAAQQNLSPINMGKMKVNIPDKNLIVKFGELANSIIDLISKLNLENQKLKQSRDILLPRLMSGTINVES